MGLVLAKRADERTRTADLISSRVCGQWLPRVAGGCKFRLGKGFVFPALQALCALGMLGIRDGTYLAHHL